MEYLNGVRLTPHLHELSPLEAAIEKFAQQAKKFHQQRKINVDPHETPEQRKKREDELAIALKHLEHERRLATVITDVQTQLQTYRDQLHSKNSTSGTERKTYRLTMKSEAHHPSKILAKFMRADGRPAPSPIHTAHHVIPGRGKTSFAARARIALHASDIRINDPANGVWMVRRRRDKGHWSMPDSNSHSEIHTKNYEVWIFKNTVGINDEARMRAALLRLRLLLEAGKQPDKVTMPPDYSWDGNE